MCPPLLPFSSVAYFDHHWELYTRNINSRLTFSFSCDYILGNLFSLRAELDSFCTFIEICLQLIVNSSHIQKRKSLKGEYMEPFTRLHILKPFYLKNKNYNWQSRIFMFFQECRDLRWNICVFILLFSYFLLCHFLIFMPCCWSKKMKIVILIIDNLLQICYLQKCSWN